MEFFLVLTEVLSSIIHGSHRPGKVMEFNPWLEKSLNFILTWKNGILPGKVIENQWKSLKKFMCHVKLNLNLQIMIIVWLKVSVCHHIWDQIGETMLGTFLAELLVTLLQLATPLVTLYQLSPVKQHIQGNINDESCLPLTVSDGAFVVQNTTILEGKN